MSIKFIASTVLTAKDQTRGVFANMAKNAKHAEQSVRNLRKAGENLKGMGRGLATTVSAPIAGLGANALKMATDFGASMNNVQAKLLISGKEMEGLRSQAKDLGSTTAFSATQAADAMGFLAQAGFDANQIMTATPTVLNLASAAQMDLATAADIASNVMGAFGLDMDSAGKNITRVSDVLALASAKSNLSVQEMAQSMKTSAPIAKAFGLEVEETSAMIGMLANMGIKGTQSGVVFKNMMTNLAKPVGQAAKAMDKLGLKQSDFFKKNKKGEMVFKGVTTMLRKLKSQGADSTDMISIFGKEAAAGMLAISKSADAIDKLQSDISVSGAAARMAKIQMQGLPRVMKEMSSAWEGANLALVESGAFEPLINGFKSITKGMSDLAKSDPEMLRDIVKALAAAAVVAPALMILGGTLAGIASIVKVVAGGFALLNAPVIAVAGLLAGAAYVIYKNWNKVSSFFKGFSEGLSEAFGEISEAIKPATDFISKAAKAISDFFKPLETYNYRSTVDNLDSITEAGRSFGKAFGLILAPLAAFAGTILALKGMAAAATSIGLLATAFKGLGVILLANPIVAIVTGIALAAALIYKHWDDIPVYFEKLMNGLADTFTKGVAMLKRIWSGFDPMGGLKATISGAAIPEHLKNEFKDLGITDAAINPVVLPNGDTPALPNPDQIKKEIPENKGWSLGGLIGAIGDGISKEFDSAKKEISSLSLFGGNQSSLSDSPPQRSLADVPVSESLAESKLSGSVKIQVESKLKLPEGFGVVNTGAETDNRTSLIKDVGVSMMAADY